MVKKRPKQQSAEHSSVFPNWKLSGPGKPPKKVQWMTQQPFALVGAWEPMAFRKRAGLGFTDEDDYALSNEYSDKAINRYLEAGATAITIPLDKGYGLNAMPEALDLFCKFSTDAQRHGLKVGGYIRADVVIPEIIKNEYPDVDDWVVLDRNGMDVPCNQWETNRKSVCHQHPGVIRRLESAIAFGIDKMKLNFIHIDGFTTCGRPLVTCRCERCRTSFRNWLKIKYPSERDRKERFGIVNFDTMEMPYFSCIDKPLFFINAPDHQSFFEYTWERDQALLKHIRRYIFSLDVDVGLCINPYWPVSFDTPYWKGVRLDLLEPWTDQIFYEDGFPAPNSGSLASRQLALKTVQENRVTVAMYHWHTKPRELEASLALSIAANSGHPSCMGFSFRYLPHYTQNIKVKIAYSNWVKKHWSLLGNASPSGDIGLVRHPTSLAWASRKPHYALTGVEYLLQRMRVPWKYVIDIHHTNLTDLSSLMIPDAECLSDREIDTLLKWVYCGGNLFMTKRTGTHNEYQSRRPRNGILSQIEDWPGHSRDEASEWYDMFISDLGEERWKAEEKTTHDVYSHGKGSIIVFSQIALFKEKNVQNISHIEKEFKIPPLKKKESDQIEKVIRQHHGAFGIEIISEAKLLVEFNESTSGKKMIHIINISNSDENNTVIIKNSSLWKKHHIMSPCGRVTNSVLNGGEMIIENPPAYCVVVH